MEKFDIVNERISDYKRYNYLGTLFSACIFLHIITKIIFNIFAKIPMPIDKWSVVDLVTCILNIGCFNIIGSITYDEVIDLDQKTKFDYYVIAVVILSWLRFFSYFLVLKSVSKLVLTLIQILYDTIAFTFITGCYLFFAGTLYCILF